MRFVNKFLSWSLYVTVMALIIFAIAANFLIIAQALFSPLNVVKGNSMSPHIMENDAVIITSANPDQLHVGDVVTFRDPLEPKDTVMHRIVDFEETEGTSCVVTKGDSNPAADPCLIPVDSVSGRVSIIIPRGGLFLSFLRSYPGFIICVICPFAILLLYLLSRWYLEESKSRKGFLAYDIIHLH